MNYLPLGFAGPLGALIAPKHVTRRDPPTDTDGNFLPLPLLHRGEPQPLDWSSRTRWPRNVKVQA